MSKSLPVLELEAGRAPLASVLAAAGAHRWPTDALEAHKEKARVAAQPKLYQWLYAYHEFAPMWFTVGMVVASFLFYFGAYEVATHLPFETALGVTFIVLATASFLAGVLFYSKLRKWETHTVEEYKKIKGGILPPESEKLMADIKNMVGHSEFHVTHLNNDPVLELEILCRSPYYTGPHMERVPVLVWDIIDHKTVIVQPPR